MTQRQRSAARTPDALASAWERQKLLVKQEQQAVSAANDAKTARLKALRLEKERQQAAAGPEKPAEQTRSKRVKRAPA